MTSPRILLSLPPRLQDTDAVSVLRLCSGAGDQPQVLKAAQQGLYRLRQLLGLCCYYLGTQLSLAHDTVWSHSLVISMSVTFFLEEDPAGNSDQMFNQGS